MDPYNVDTHRRRYTEKRRRQCVPRGRDWGDAATNQGMPGAPRRGTDRSRFSPRALGGSAALPAPSFCFWLPELPENNFLLFSATQFVTICYRSNRKGVHFRDLRDKVRPRVHCSHSSCLPFSSPTSHWIVRVCLESVFSSRLRVQEGRDCLSSPLLLPRA